MLAALIGPLFVALAALVGRGLGAAFGLSAFGIVIGSVLAVGAAVAMGTWKGISAGFALLFVVLLTGAMNLSDSNSIALLESGEHVVGAQLEDEAAWRGHERVSFATGEPRGDLYGVATHYYYTDRMHHIRTPTSCTATPIVPAAWAPTTPVRVWSLSTRFTPLPFSERAYHEVEPDDLCNEAIAQAIAWHHLEQAPGAIYLERLDSSTDTSSLRSQGLAAAIVCGGMWFLIGLILVARDALATWQFRRQRRREERHPREPPAAPTRRA